MITDFSSLNLSSAGKSITVGGFVHTIRDHGGLIFIDLRSQSELLQCVINPEKNQAAFKLAESVHSEYVLKITGTVIPRDKEAINPKLPTGEIELEIEKVEIVSKAKTMPFDIHAEGGNLAGEETRLKYRYLDLRREKLKKMMTQKHKLFLAVRNWFDSQDFIEVTTPILANSSPEGARDYLVPSRIHPGKFYALPQAPQQFKQLLMVGGFNKYFQIAPCFRDEDPRADRHPGDFYQIDAEIAWADQESIFELCEKLARECLINFSDKRLAEEQFIRLRYDESMDKYGSDKPDLRYDLAWADAKPVFKNSGFKVFADLCKVSLPSYVKKGKEVISDIIEKTINSKEEHLGYVVLADKDFNLLAEKDLNELTIKGLHTKDILDNYPNFSTSTISEAIFNIDLQQEFFKHAKIGSYKLENLSEIENIYLVKTDDFQTEYQLGSHNVFILQVKEDLNIQKFKGVINKGEGDYAKRLLKDISNHVNKNSSNTRVQALVIKNAVDKFSRSDLDRVQDIGRQYGLPGIAYIQYFEDGAKSPIFKFFGDTEEIIEAKKAELQKYFDLQTGDLVLFIANPDKNIVFKAQNQMRQHIAKHLGVIDESILRFAWVYDFPFYEQDEKTQKIDFGHNPFGVWKPNEGQNALQTLEEAIKNETLLDLRAIQYDLTLNGYEVLSGGVRNSNPEALLAAFKVAGYTEEEVRAKFKHMMEAYEFGAPPHAGFAWGLERLFMILMEEDNIREIIAFPKNGSGIDVMTNSPSAVSPKQLKELSIKVVE